MLLSDYTVWRRHKTSYPGQSTFQGLIYTALALGGEVGEFANKVKKIWRSRGGAALVSDVERLDLLLELGDALWYIDATAEELDSSLAEVAYLNMDKLNLRHQERKDN